MSSRAVPLDGSKIRELRKLLGLSQAEMAKKIGITQAQLSRLESGWTTSYQTAEKIASVLGVEVGWLLKKMPGDVRRNPEDLWLAWMDLIEGKTSELREGMETDNLPMDAVLGADRLHRDVTTYAGPKLGLMRGDSKIGLALDELRSTVEEAYPIAVKLTLGQTGSVEELRRREGRKTRVRKSA